MEKSLWAGTFGNEYNQRNSDYTLVENNKHFFYKALKNTYNIKTVLELGCGTGNNFPAFCDKIYYGIDINKQALAECIARYGYYKSAIFKNIDIDGLKLDYAFDLVFTKGVLIHIGDDALSATMDKMVQLSKKYILIAEYYNPKRKMIPYRGMRNILFKDDFASKFLDKYPLRLIDYGFIYHRDEYPQDDLTWFLLQK